MDGKQHAAPSSQGLSKLAVEELLGRPAKVSQFTDASCWWHYGYPLVGGLTSTVMVESNPGQNPEGLAVQLAKQRAAGPTLTN